jgi:threonylcarbamoyladenosine tRNA methylthiotransferase MtaB
MGDMRIFKTITLGCRVNQFESDAVSSRLEDGGWVAATHNETPDIYIINTCAVTQKAAQQSRQAVRHAIRTHPNARILVTGCYAQLEPDEIRRIPGVTEIIAQEEKFDIPKRFCDLTEDTLHRFLISSPQKRTRPSLKIQDGCDAFCTYCIVPYARGRNRSMPPDAVLENIRRLKNAGFHEVVLSGIHLGCYGLDIDTEQTRLIDLLSRIDRDGTIDRVRLSSIEPLELTEAVIGLVATSNHLCHHFHIPLQSGDDRILKQMHRPYSRDQFRTLILRIQERVPDAAIGVDVLIGFPGETDRAFQNTYTLIEELPVSYLHVFPYSPRKGTPASGYPDQVQADVKKERCRYMRKLGIQKKMTFYKRFLGKRINVLIETIHCHRPPILKGLTSNYIPVSVEGSVELQNKIISVKLVRLSGDHTVWGAII